MNLKIKQYIRVLGIKIIISLILLFAITTVNDIYSDRGYISKMKKNIEEPVFTEKVEELFANGK